MGWVLSLGSAAAQRSSPVARRPDRDGRAGGTAFGYNAAQQGLDRARDIRMTLLKAACLAVTLLASTAAYAARTDIVLGMQLEPPNLDPTAGAAEAIDEVVYANVFEGLTRILSDGGVAPALARSWDISADGLTYTFRLATGVRFHDGTTFDASDVKYSLDRARGPESANAQKGLFAPIARVDVVDPATVRVTLERPVGNFLFNMGWGDAVIVAPESTAGNATRPIGTGPFRFATWVKGDRVDLVRNPDYWGTPARLDKVTFKFISDPTAAYAAMRAGDVDAFPVFPALETLASFRGDPRFTVVVGTTEGETILAINNAKPPFDNAAVRRAIAMAIDRKAIIDGAQFGYGTPIGTHFAPHNPAYVDLTGAYPYDPTRAREMLRAAGVPNSFRVTLKLPPVEYARRGGEIIASQLRAVGIDAQIIPIEWAQWLSEVFARKDYDLTIVSHTEPLDIDIYARDDYYFGYRSEAFKKIMADLNLATDAARRLGLLQAAQRQIAADAVNVFLFELAKAGVWNAKVRGLWSNMPIGANDVTAVYWVD
jgi:peptide/nickel transport system substrate-binding protein